MESKRNSNFELLRILTMLCVVASHGCVFSFTTPGFLGKFYSLYYAFGYAGLNSFFMMSGYFMGNRPTVSKKKILSIFIQVIYCQFLALAIFLVLKTSGLCSYSGITMMQYFGFVIEFYMLPITSDIYWYITAYIILLALLPVINPFIQKLNQKGFIILLLVEGILWFGFSELRHYRYAHVQRAVFFYSLGAFFKIYANQKNIKRLIISILLFIPVYLCSTYAFMAFHNLPEDCSAYMDMALHFTSYAILSPLTSILMFEIFKNLTFSSSAINLISATTFSIYILHCQPFVGYPRMIFAPQGSLDMGTAKCLIYSLANWISTFAVCSLLDLIRLKLLNKKINLFTEKMLSLIDSKLYIHKNSERTE
ncbi:MAG: acyltransferase [Treponema sp.]|nr:acyltransferase [Treponema sp.]